MKWCTRCKIEQRESEFSRNARTKDGLQTWCKACKRAVTNDHYRRNRELELLRSKKNKDRRRMEIRQKVYDYLLMNPCVDCGEADPVVLEFDHVRGAKKFRISDRAFSVVPSWKSLMVEIEKCEVRCANCHRRRTAKHLNWHIIRLSDAVQLPAQGVKVSGRLV